MPRPLLCTLFLLAACGEDLAGPTTASLELTAVTSGGPVDSDGYLAHVDGGHETPLGVNATVLLADLSPGDHEVSLDGIADGCSLAGSNPRTVSVKRGEVGRVRFEVECRPAATGTLRITTSTEGPRPDLDGYRVSVAGAEQPMTANGSVTVFGIPVGTVEVELTGVATNCRVEGENPRSIPLAIGDDVTVAFAVTCEASAEGILLLSSDRSGATHLYTVREDGSDLRDLTPTFEAASGDWSPDGSQIVLSRPGTAGPELFVMKADGSEIRPLGVPGARPRWSPDGQKIVFGADGQVMTVNADGTGATALVEGADPDWSPDGRQIAFDRVDLGRCVPFLFCPSDLFVINADGTELHRLVTAANASDVLSLPNWSPDGRQVAFTRSCCFLGPNTTGLYVVSAQGGLPRLIYAGAARGPVWSPDGAALAFSIVQGNGDTDIKVIPAAGGPGRILASSPDSEYPQAWR